MKYNFEITGILEASTNESAEMTFNNIASWLQIKPIPQFKLTYSTEPHTIGKNFEPPTAT